MIIIKNSQTWEKELGVTIIDPDGWDRQDFENSWNELITQEEFVERALISSIKPSKKFFQLAEQNKI